MTNLLNPDVASVREGDVLDGKYRIERVLGIGGMGVVVAATHLQLGQRVALKFLLPSALGDEQVVARFAREARAAVRIQSEHVARVIDVGALATGSPYMVMEFLEGGDLEASLARRGALPVDEAVGWILQACEAIAEAHSLGIVHRDLKPANLFLARKAGRDAIVKVLDFGISKTSESGAPSALTKTSAMLGSPLYMAPEQMTSPKDVDARCDIWSLGVILYELVAGVPPFTAETMPELVYLITQRDPPPLREKRVDAPPAFGEVVARCLRRAPAERYGNVAELVAALVPFGPPRSEVSLERVSRLLGAPAPSSTPNMTVAPALMKQTASTWASTGTNRATWNRGRLVGAGAAVAALLLVGTYLASRSTSNVHAAAAVAAPPTAPANVTIASPPSAMIVSAPMVSVKLAPIEPGVASAPSATTSSTAGSKRPRGTVPPASTAPSAPTPTPRSDPLHMEMK